MNLTTIDRDAHRLVLIAFVIVVVCLIGTATISDPALAQEGEMQVTDSFDGLSDRVQHTAIGPEGNLYATSGSTVTQIDVDDMSVVDGYTGHTSDITAIEISPNGYLYASSQSTIHRVDTDGMSLEGTNSYGTDVNTIHYSDTSEQLYIGTSGTVHEIDPSTLSITTSSDLNADVRSLGVHPSGYIYAGSNGGSLFRLDRPGLQVDTFYSGHDFVINDFAITDNGDIITGSSDNEVHKINEPDLTLITSYKSYPGSVSDVELDSDGFVYISGSEPIHRLSQDALTEEGDITINETSTVDSMVYNSDNKRLYVGHEDTTVYEVYVGVGDAPEQPQLQIDAPKLMDHGQTDDYRVIYTDGNGNRQGVTSEATVTSNNTSVVTVDQTAFELTATGDIEIQKRTHLTAEYDGLTTTQNVTVANASIENLAILPAWGRITALFGGDTPTEDPTIAQGIFPFLVMVFMAIAATKFTGAFGGIAAYTLSSIILWFGGYLEVGGVFIALFMSLFVGLNLAANVDYQVRR